MLLARLPSFLLLTPFVLVFLYAAWHEYSRFKRHGTSSYGLNYDPATNSTYVTALADDADHLTSERLIPIEIAAASPASDLKEQDITS